MVNRNLIRNLDDDDITNELAVLAPEEEADEWLLEWLEREQQDYAQGEIVDGRIVEVDDESALIDVGFKSEGTVPLNEWDHDEDPPEVGDTVKVLIEEMEDELGAADDPYGMISLSKRKAEKIIEWEKMMARSARAKSSPVRSPARSRAACWSTSASTSSCPPARSTSAVRATSATSSAA